MESLLEILSYAFWVILAITILVFVHELGHFLFAKLFKMRVDRFSIGFPPKIFGKKIGETEYVVGATPLGGYVKIQGMIDESMDTDFTEREPEPWEFRAKPVWQRIIVITAGVTFNLILAAVIFAGLKYTYGETYIPAENVEAVYVEENSLAHEIGLRTGDRILEVGGKKPERLQGSVIFDDPQALLADTFTVTVVRHRDTLTLVGPQDIVTRLSQVSQSGENPGISFAPSLVGGVVEDSPAAEIGLQTGDRIVALGRDSVRFWQQLTEQVQASEGRPITIRWERPDSLMGAASDDPPVAQAHLVEQTRTKRIYEARVTPRKNESDGRYLLGIFGPEGDLLFREFGVKQEQYSLGEAVVAGVIDTWGTTKAITISFKRLFTGREGLDSVGGPVMIAKVTKDAAEAGADRFWEIVALLSITLAIVNILPIPALDGGHLIFLIYEGITRRAPSVRVRMALQQIGMVILLVLMVFLVFNDILRL